MNTLPHTCMLQCDLWLQAGSQMHWLFLTRKAVIAEEWWNWFWFKHGIVLWVHLLGHYCWFWTYGPLPQVCYHTHRSEIGAAVAGSPQIACYLFPCLKPPVLPFQAAHTQGACLPLGRQLLTTGFCFHWFSLILVLQSSWFLISPKWIPVACLGKLLLSVLPFFCQCLPNQPGSGLHLSLGI